MVHCSEIISPARDLPDHRLYFTVMKTMLMTTFLSLTAAEQFKVQKSSMNVLNSETLPGNLLPNFMFQQGSIEGGSIGVKIGGGRGTAKPFTPDDTCTDDIFEGAMTDMRSPQLPYLTQVPNIIISASSLFGVLFLINIFNSNRICGLVTAKVKTSQRFSWRTTH